MVSFVTLVLHGTFLECSPLLFNLQRQTWHDKIAGTFVVLRCSR